MAWHGGVPKKGGAGKKKDFEKKTEQSEGRGSCVSRSRHRNPHERKLKGEETRGQKGLIFSVEKEKNSEVGV